MRRLQLFVSSLATVVVFLLCVSLSFAQTKVVQQCQSKEKLKLRGFFLGQTVDEIKLLIPNFQDAFREADNLNIDINKEVGYTGVDSTPIFYRQSGVRRVPRNEFKDVDFSWHFFEGRLCFLGVKYLEYEPPNIQYFIKQVSEKTHLPMKGWVIHDKYRASIKCAGFIVELWTGRTPSYYQDYPSIQLTDMVAAAEVKRLQDAIKKRKKNEERERIRREREKKLILKP